MLFLIVFKHEEDAWSEAVAAILVLERGNLSENGTAVIQLLLNFTTFYNLRIKLSLRP